jgi:hypothetical protein
MRRRTHRSLLIAVVLLAALAVIFYLRQGSPPEAARLLPECDAIVFLQLKTLRAATHFDATPVSRSPDFQRFIDATGIVPERDLDSVAFGLHRMADPSGPNGPVAYSEVFVGTFDGVRLAKYLGGIASARETYAGHQIFTIPVEGRQLRVAQVGYDTIAASNMPTAEQIHSILDRHRASGLWAPGSSLLAARYREVPQLPLPAVAWAIGHIGLPFAENGHISILGLELPLSEDTDLVASLRYSGSVHLRVEEIAPTESEALRTTETMGTLLTIFRSVQDAQPAVTPGAQAMRSLVDSIEIQHVRKRAILSAVASTDQIRALASAANTAPADAGPLAPNPLAPNPIAPYIATPPTRRSSKK